MTSPRTRRLALATPLLAAWALAGCAGPTPVVSPGPSTPVTPTAAASGTPSPTPLASTPPATPAGTPSPSATASALGCPASDGTSLKAAPGKGKTVALTFDDGPGPQTLQVADALAAAGVHATFFVTGQHASANPDVVRALADRGHLVAGHSWDHRYPKAVPGGWTAGFVADQVSRTATLLQQQTGRPACFFRPPGGFLDGVPAAARRTAVVVTMWSVDSLDWKQPDSTTKAATAEIVANATKVGDQSHPIVLFHDAKASAEPDSKVSPNRSNTIAALPEVIAWYQAKGYAFVRLDGRS